MPIHLILPLSLVLSLISWTLLVVWYLNPWVRSRGLSRRVVEMILLIHTLRYIGLMFLIPGVTAEPLDLRFANPAAYGDLITALLAFVALFFVRYNWRRARLMVLSFNLFGFFDLLNALGRGILYTQDGHLGAAFWIPATIVPMLLVSHVYLFVLLAQITKVEDIRGRLKGMHKDSVSSKTDTLFC